MMNLVKEGKANEIRKITITNGENIILVKLANATADREKSVIVPAEAKEDLLRELNKNNIPIDTKEPDKSGLWMGMLSSFFLPILVLVGSSI